MKSLILLFILPAAVAFGQTAVSSRLENSPRHREWVKVKSGDREISCFITYPEVAGPALGVVVIHEIFGLSDWARSVTDQLAEHGYVAIAPDLLSDMAPGGGGTAAFGSRDAVVKAVSSLPPTQVTADLNAVTDYLARLPACNGRVVVAGFCWGGGQAFRFASDRADLRAAFVFYGPAPKTDDLARIRCPVYGFYAGNDARITSTVPATAAAMKAAGKTYDPVIYDGAGHGFMRAGEDDNASAANRQAMDAGWKRWLELLGRVNES